MAVLNRLENGETVPLREGRDQDHGLFTRALWQQSIAGNNLVAWLRRRRGVVVKKVFALVTYLADLRADGTVRQLYLDALISKAALYAEPFWRGPEWFEVDDLESLVCLGERGNLNLQQILEERANRAADRFDVFLHERFPAAPITQRLREAVEQLLGEAAKAFFGEDLAQPGEGGV